VSDVGYYPVFNIVHVVWMHGLQGHALSALPRRRMVSPLRDLNAKQAEASILIDRLFIAVCRYATCPERYPVY